NGHQRPEQRKPELRPGEGVGVNAARVVVHVGGDNSGAQDGQENQQSRAELAKPFAIHGELSSVAALSERRVFESTGRRPEAAATALQRNCFLLMTSSRTSSAVTTPIKCPPSSTTG